MRWVEFVALITLLGALGFRHGVLPSLAARQFPTADAADRARRIGQGAIVLYLVAAVVRLYTESRALYGPEALNPALLRSILTASTWGLGWTLGVAGALALAIAWKLSKHSVAIGTPLALAGGLSLALSPALAGHAAAGDPMIVSVALDAVHVMGVGAWIGGLLMVVIAGMPAMRALPDGRSDVGIAALVNSFHPVALLAAPAVALTGVGNSWIRLGTLDALWSTTYGTVLLWKLGAVAVVMATGFYNTARVRRALGGPAGTLRVRRTALFELAFASLVLAITTALVVTPVPSDHLP